MTANQQQALDHLVWLATRKPWMNDHAHNEWKLQAWRSAKELAQEPEHADLPAQVAAELERLRRSRATPMTIKAGE